MKNIEQKHKISIQIMSYEEMVLLGKLLGSLVSPNVVIALSGDLGAGKTTLTKGIGQSLGVKSTVNSPTFTIMKVYKTSSENIPWLYHLDMYRTSGSSTDFDLEEYFYLGGCTVIEWANIILDMLPGDALYIDIKITSSTSRDVTIESIDKILIDKINERLQVQLL